MQILMIRPALPPAERRVGKLQRCEQEFPQKQKNRVLVTERPHGTWRKLQESHNVSAPRTEVDRLSPH